MPSNAPHNNATNRIIKFRAWDTIHNRMSGLFSLINCINQDQVFCCPENFEFMQFTGLLDKNGKDIYEGDILLKYQPQTGLRMGISVVEWHNHSSRFAGISYTFDMEVIGNIYENKELL